VRLGESAASEACLRLSPRQWSAAGNVPYVERPEEAGG